MVSTANVLMRIKKVYNVYTLYTTYPSAILYMKILNKIIHSLPMIIRNCISTLVGGDTEDLLYTGSYRVMYRYIRSMNMNLPLIQYRNTATGERINIYV